MCLARSHGSDILERDPLSAAPDAGLMNAIRTLHVPYGYLPDPVGGTEIYVRALAAALQDNGHPASIAAPGTRNQEYERDSLLVHRFAVASTPSNIGELYGDGDQTAARHFDALLQRLRPDIVHLHAFTPACSVLLVQQAKARAIPVVFTYHTPTVSCLRGTLMLWGDRQCDGILDAGRCAACALHARGVPRPLTRAIGRVPALSPDTFRGPHRLWTTIGLSSLTQRLHVATRQLFERVDRIVAPRGWVEELLKANGVPQEKIVRSGQPLCHVVPPAPRVARRDGPMRVAFFGRLDPTKGLDVLLGGLHLVPSTVAIELRIFAMAGERGSEGLERLRQAARIDARVHVHDPLAPADVPAEMAAHHVVAVPSQGFETGPLVVLEALAAGALVVGSRLGGIAELVRDPEDGVLVSEFARPQAWADALTRLTTERDRFAGRHSPTRPLRTPAAVAREMLAVYSGLTTPDEGAVLRAH